MEPEIVHPETTEKPWGFFRLFAKNQKSTVKILHVQKGEEFSLQDHEHRVEFWHVLSGLPVVTVGQTEIESKPGDEYTIPAKTAHRVFAPKGDVEILEVSLGEFDENDITRIQDKYGRV